MVRPTGQTESRVPRTIAGEGMGTPRRRPGQISMRPASASSRAIWTREMVWAAMSSPRRARSAKRSMMVASVPASRIAHQLAWCACARASALQGKLRCASSRRRRPTSVCTSFRSVPPCMDEHYPAARARVLRSARQPRRREEEREDAHPVGRGEAFEADVGGDARSREPSTAPRVPPRLFDGQGAFAGVWARPSRRVPRRTRGRWSILETMSTATATSSPARGPPAHRRRSSRPGSRAARQPDAGDARGDAQREGVAVGDRAARGQAIAGSPGIP